MDRLRALILIGTVGVTRERERLQSQRRERENPMASKFEAAITEFEKLDIGLDAHGEKLIGRMAGVAQRADEVVKRAHAKLDARDAKITAMDRMVDRLDQVGNGPPRTENPTKDSSTASLTGSTDSTNSEPSSATSAEETATLAEETAASVAPPAQPALGEPQESWAKGRRC